MQTVDQFNTLQQNELKPRKKTTTSKKNRNKILLKKIKKVLSVKFKQKSVLFFFSFWLLIYASP